MCERCFTATNPADINQPAMLEWINALESGLYPQTTERLVLLDDETCEPAGYCCLGVAVELFADRCGVQIRTTEAKCDRSFVWTVPNSDPSYATTATMLPRPVAELLGISYPTVSHAGDVIVEATRYAGDEPEWVNLSTLNDEWGWDFAQIAAILRATFLSDTDV